MPLHSDTLSWFPNDRSLLFLLSRVLGGEAANINLTVLFGLIGARTHDRSDEHEASTIIITPPIELIYEELGIMNVNVYTTKSCAYGMWLFIYDEELEYKYKYVWYTRKNCGLGMYMSIGWWTVAKEYKWLWWVFLRETSRIFTC